MKLLGRPVAQKIEGAEILPLTSKNHYHLAIVLIGEDGKSQIYVREKVKSGRKLGIEVSVYHFTDASDLPKIQETVRYLNEDEDVAGIIIQLPLPETFASETNQLISLIYQSKDVDSLTDENRHPSVSFPLTHHLQGDKEEGGHLEGVNKKRESRASFSEKFHQLKDAYRKSKILMPPTATGIMEILDFYQIDLREATLIGRGLLVGNPVARLLDQMLIPYQVIHSQTSQTEKKKLLKNASVIVSGTSSTEPIFSIQDIPPKAVVIDCAADFDHNDNKQATKVSYTPAIDGVGPVTVACLLRNVVWAKQWQK